MKFLRTPEMFEIQLVGVAHGLQYLHNQPTIHGDVKGVNLLIFTPFGLLMDLLDSSTS